MGRGIELCYPREMRISLSPVITRSQNAKDRQWKLFSASSWKLKVFVPESGSDVYHMNGGKIKNDERKKVKKEIRITEGMKEGKSGGGGGGKWKQEGKRDKWRTNYYSKART